MSHQVSCSEYRVVYLAFVQGNETAAHLLLSCILVVPSLRFLCSDSCCFLFVWTVWIGRPGILYVTGCCCLLYLQEGGCLCYRMPLLMRMQPSTCSRRQLGRRAGWLLPPLQAYTSSLLNIRSGATTDLKTFTALFCRGIHSVRNEPMHNVAGYHCTWSGSALSLLFPCSMSWQLRAMSASHFLVHLEVPDTTALEVILPTGRY